MEMIIDETNLESKAYRILLEEIKENGIDDFYYLMDDIEKIKLSRENFLEKAIFESTHPTLSLNARNRKIIAFLQEYKNELKTLDITSDKFIRVYFDKLYPLLREGKIDTVLENMKSLEKLKVCKVMITEFFMRDFYTKIWTKNDKITDIIKQYSNKKLYYKEVRNRDGYKEYKTETNSLINEWVLQAENHADGRQYRYFYLANLLFDIKDLPTEEEISSYEITEDLKRTLQR